MIITTRDMHILRVYGSWLLDSQNTRVSYDVYEVPLLNNNDARELFYRKAFKSKNPTSGCVKLTPKVLDYAQGLPLAVQVVGSFLCTRNANQWTDALYRLRNNPDKKIMDVLQVSFEGLHSEEKEIFLHIACFFKGEKEDYVKRILDACELHPLIGIQSLIERSLITIRNQEIHMHDMLRELGKNIVRQRFPNEPGSWSRLWLYEDFFHVMMTEMGTNMVKAIILDQKEDISKYPQLTAEGLSIMRGLKILILYHKNFSGNLNFLSNSLQYLLWHSFPFASLPLDFEPFRLVELNMPRSRIHQLWGGRKDLPCLKRVDLSNSKYIVETPNFAGCPMIELLDFTGCINLSYAHPSIGLLENLALLSLEGCSSLVRLVLDGDTGPNLYSLKVLHLSGCTKLETIPDFTGVSNLEYLDIDQCASLSMIDQSIGDLAKLKVFSLRDCTNLVSIPRSINSMTSLVTLDLCGCIKLENLPLLRSIPVPEESIDFTSVSSENVDISVISDDEIIPVTEQSIDFTSVSSENVDISNDELIPVPEQSIDFISVFSEIVYTDDELIPVPEESIDVISVFSTNVDTDDELIQVPEESTDFISVSSENVDISDNELISSYYLNSLIFLDLSFCNLTTVPDAIGELQHLERLNLEGNNFISLPSSMELYCLAYLNLAHCSKLQSLPELHLCATSSSGGRYFKMLSGSHNHRSGLYIFNCPLLEMAEDHDDLALSWLKNLLENPCHFRCGLDIVVPGYTVPEWFHHQFKGNAIVKIAECMNEFDNWIGFAFCVAFVENCRPTTSSSSHYSLSSQLPYPLYLSFESEQMEETFDMPLRLDVKMFDGSNTEHLWLIYISRPHCHFVTTGAQIAFKAHPDLELKTWGLHMVFGNDIYSIFEGGRNEVHQQDFLHLDHVHESSSSSRPEIQLPYNWGVSDEEKISKFQLRYNWHVTEEEESEDREVNAKQNNVLNMDLPT